MGRAVTPLEPGDVLMVTRLPHPACSVRERASALVLCGGPPHISVSVLFAKDIIVQIRDSVASGIFRNEKYYGPRSADRRKTE